MNSWFPCLLPTRMQAPCGQRVALFGFQLHPQSLQWCLAYDRIKPGYLTGAGKPCAAPTVIVTVARVATFVIRRWQRWGSFLLRNSLSKSSQFLKREAETVVIILFTHEKDSPRKHASLCSLCVNILFSQDQDK